ncbi:MAG: Glycosyl hydrolases family 28 [Firmicutes bacterium ADurb.Bin182]|nr:MAG: Glycosyl hydrolases family 28 [Firmicutes bacterium ADurb.Bin182]
MNEKKAVTLPVICLGAAAVLFLAFAAYMIIASNAPRLNLPSSVSNEYPAGEKGDAATKLTVYEGPKTMKTSEAAIITANGNELFVYDVMVNHEHIWNANTIPSYTPMTYFDFEGEVTIDIQMPGLGKNIESAAVLPALAGIVPEVKDNHVTFTVTRPGQYTVIYNDSVNKATHIFANPLETDIPDKDDPNVIYIGPGEWSLDAIVLKSDHTLYISGGAVLHTVVIADRAANVTIRGRGIIDGSDYAAHNQPGSYARVPVDISGSKNITAEGFILANSNCWNFNSFSSENVHISNVKIISGRQNGDGFTFQSCKNHKVVDSFARTWDDSLVLKNYSGSTRDITFENIQIWTDLAQSMEIGYETNKGLTIDPEIYNVLFKDITVLYNFHKPVISIHNSDDAYVHDITYQNITVENAFMQGDNGRNKELIEMTLQNSGWSTVTDEFGRIENILIDGLTVLNTADGKVPESRFSGQSNENMISGVTMRNISILGEKITDLDALKASVNEFCADITVE